MEISTSSISSSSSSASSQNASPESESFSMAGGDESLTKASTTTNTKINGVAANTAFRNYQYFTKQSAVDYKSSSQLIFDVLMQMIEVSFIFGFSFFFYFSENFYRNWIFF